MRKYLLISFLFVSVVASAQSWLWGRQNTGDGVIYGGVPLIEDSIGNAIVSVSFYDTIYLGSHLLRASSPSGSAFIAEYDTTGKIRWINQIKGGGIFPSTLIKTATGGFYIEGGLTDTAVFGSTTLTSSPPMGDVFLAKYDKNNNVIWAKQSNCSGSPIYLNAVASDGGDNIYMDGEFEGTIQFGSSILTSPSSFNSAFIVKYDSSGTVQWAISPSSTAHQLYCYGITTDRAGNIYMAGSFGNGTITFGSSILNSGRNTDMFIAKYSSSGKAIWAKQTTTNGSGLNQAGSLITDKYANLYVTGSFGDSVYLDASHLIYNPSPQDIFLAKYDSSGNVIWAEGADGNKVVPADWGGGELITDTVGNVYLTGEANASAGYNDSLEIGGLGIGIVANPGFDEVAFILKLDYNGTAICGSMLNGTGEYCSMAADPESKYIYYASNLKNQIVLASDTLGFSSIGNCDAQRVFMIARWQPCEGGEQGINELLQGNKNVLLFPNPNNGVFTIQLAVDSRQATVEIYNVLGEKVYCTPLNLPQGGDFKIDLGPRPEGVYLYRVLTETGELISEGKFVIQK